MQTYMLITATYFLACPSLTAKTIKFIDKPEKPVNEFKLHSSTQFNAKAAIQLINVFEEIRRQEPNLIEQFVS